jgi:hypothetical protein
MCSAAGIDWPGAAPVCSPARAPLDARRLSNMDPAAHGADRRVRSGRPQARAILKLT